MADTATRAPDRADGNDLAQAAHDLPNSGPGHALAVIFLVVAVASAMFFGWRGITDELHLNSPLAKFVALGIPIVSGIVTIVLSIRGFFGKYTKAVLVVLVVAIPVFVAGCIALYVTNDPIDLKNGHPVAGTLVAGGDEQHTFEVGPGDRAMLRLDPSADLMASVTVEQGNLVFDAVATTPGQRVSIDETLPGGTWTVTVRALARTEGRYQLTLAVDDDGQSLKEGSEFDHESLVEAGDTNGYVLSRMSGRRLVTLDPVTPGLDLIGRVVVDTFLRGQGTAVGHPLSIPVDLSPEKVFVVIVGSTNHQSGEYRLRVSADPNDVAPRAATATTVEPSPPTTDELVTVPEMFGINQDLAKGELIALGFPVRSYAVCSSSVGAGQVRQVLYETADKAIVVDDKPGAPSVGRAPKGVGLTLKVGTGQGC